MVVRKAGQLEAQNYNYLVFIIIIKIMTILKHWFQF